MINMIRRLVNRIFPELRAGYHLPALAVVTAVSTDAALGGLTDAFRPRYAVDVLLLDEQGNIDKSMPEIKSVPVSIPSGNNQGGVFGLPQTNSIVEICWANGRAHRPFIRGILADSGMITECDSDHIVIQQRTGVKQSVDDGGNWLRQTDSTISDQSSNHVIEAHEKIETLIDELKKVGGHSVEEIYGHKIIEAGSIIEMAENHITQGASNNLSTVAGMDIMQAAGRNCQSVAGEKNCIEGRKLYLGNSSDNVLSLLSAFMSETSKALQALSTHTHNQKQIAPMDEGSKVANAGAAIVSEKSKLDSMI